MIGNLFGKFDSDSEFGETFSTLLNKFAKLSNSKIILHHFDEEIPYTIKEIQFLQLLLDNSDMRNIDIARALDVTKGMVSKMISKLEKNGVIIKKNNPENAREIQLLISDVGKSHLLTYSSRINSAVSELYQEWLSIDIEARESFQRIVEKYTEILDNLSNNG